ncbi:unnamed protein product [Bursaphelenchus xylophilus]|uniref:(pine wood nematode) hypothetical protein n=1 Tax=Bursaphelenchus xylophilus TaxID=6326 RepID=A0A1I7S774_BURXY|nr:unnamed protein product [Bursaphelenchus xylophilus]CAG9084702.1 unnamed protein product [Bursaphelenchus xylophilus]
MTAKLRQHSLSNLVHDCNVNLAGFRSVIQGIGTPSDSSNLRKEVDISIKTCMKTYEATKSCVLPQLKHEGTEFNKYASQFIGCVSACVNEMKRCEALEKTFPQADGPSSPLATPYIPELEEILESLENLITVHYSTSESSPDTKVTPRRRRGGTCRPQCMCSKLKTSYA